MNENRLMFFNEPIKYLKNFIDGILYVFFFFHSVPTYIENGNLNLAKEISKI